MQEAILAIGCGGLVGFVLGLIGGGGSILAVPLLLYVVGVEDPHLAIGTAALAVAVNAAANLIPHARAGTIKWPCAAVFALAGVVGATLGSTLGKQVDGQQLLLFFALAMVLVGVHMLRSKSDAGDPAVHINKAIAVRLTAVGFGAGSLAGFFGIGGGFVIVPGLMLASGMPLLNAIGSSLIAVAVFGLTTAGNYALSGLVDWPLAGLLLVGGVAGGWLGMRAALRLATRRRLLTQIFAGAIFAVALLMVWKAVVALGWI